MLRMDLHSNTYHTPAQLPANVYLLWKQAIYFFCLKSKGVDAQGPTLEQQLAGFPKVRTWMEQVRAELEPHYSSVHAMLDKAVQSAVRRKERQQKSQAKL